MYKGYFLENTSTLTIIIGSMVLIWLIVLVVSLVSLLRRKDMLLPVKIFWGAVIFFAPVIGLIFYVVYGISEARRKNKKRTDTSLRAVR